MNNPLVSAISSMIKHVKNCAVCGKFIDAIDMSNHNPGDVSGCCEEGKKLFWDALTELDKSVKEGKSRLN